MKYILSSAAQGDSLECVEGHGIYNLENLQYANELEIKKSRAAVCCAFPSLTRKWKARRRKEKKTKKNRKKRKERLKEERRKKRRKKEGRKKEKKRKKREENERKKKGRKEKG